MWNVKRVLRSPTHPPVLWFFLCIRAVALEPPLDSQFLTLLAFLLASVFLSVTWVTLPLRVVKKIALRKK